MSNIEKLAQDLASHEKVCAKNHQEVIGRLGVVERDVSELKGDVSELKDSVKNLESDMAGMRVDLLWVKRLMWFVAVLYAANSVALPAKILKFVAVVM